MSNLIIPEYLQKAEEKREEKAKELSDMQKLPKPTGWRLLIMPHSGIKKTKGGVHLTDKAQEEIQLTTNVGLVLKVGPDAYKDSNRFPDGPWCKEKDWVLFAKYAGSRIKIEGGELRLLNDDEVLAVIEDPEDILHATYK
uniref:Co-chaperonin GroES n=1 Tax=uncultured virus TaxID=340016 RepID=A0A221S2V6_9VIRU|nr:co-chaperonin GroES [uncultured virus]